MTEYHPGARPNITNILDQIAFIEKTRKLLDKLHNYKKTYNEDDEEHQVADDLIDFLCYENATFDAQSIQCPKLKMMCENNQAIIDKHKDIKNHQVIDQTDQSNLSPNLR